MKHCRGCSKDLPLTAFGLRGKADPRPLSRCRTCRSGATRHWQTANPEQARAISDSRYQRCGDAIRADASARAKAKRAADPDGARAAARAKYAADPVRVRVKNREYRARNLESARDRERAYAKANREKRRAAQRAQYHADRDRRLAKNRAWRARNAELCRRVAKAYRETNPGMVRATYALIRARKRAATVEHVIPARVFERDGWVCYLCMKPVDRTAPPRHPDAPVLEHIAPLSKGGAHSYANTACAHAACNARKYNRPWHECSALLD